MTSKPKLKIKKPNLSESLLNESGIYFFPVRHTPDKLPKWIRPIQGHILSFRGKLAREMRDDFVEELQDHLRKADEKWDDAPPDVDKKSVFSRNKKFARANTSEKMRKTLEFCEEVRDRIKVVRERKQAECKWHDLLGETIFRSFQDVYQDSTPHQDTHSRWEVHRDLSWNEFDYAKRTGPKPDFTYALPIIDPFKMSDSQSVFSAETTVEGLSLPVLAELRNNPKVKLRSAPSTSLQRYGKEKNPKLGAEHLICFPWAVVEIKKSEATDANVESCYCQAANATAAALDLRERLVLQAGGISHKNNALVIFAFTCVGPHAKVWITYRNTVNKNVEMRCIWASSLELTWGVLVLSMAIKNMKEWVYNNSKPKLAEWVCTLREKHRSPTIITPEGDVVQTRRRATSSITVRTTSILSSPTTPDQEDFPARSSVPDRGKTAPELPTRRTLRPPHETPSPTNRTAPKNLPTSTSDSENEVQHLRTVILLDTPKFRVEPRRPLNQAAHNKQSGAPHEHNESRPSRSKGPSSRTKEDVKSIVEGKGNVPRKATRKSLAPGDAGLEKTSQLGDRRRSSRF